MTDVIRDLPRDDRPRERMFMHGAQVLSDAELIAVLLGSGVRGQNAVQLARKLIADGTLDLRKPDVHELAKAHGMGPAKAARVVAAFEFGKRLTTIGPPPPAPPDLDIGQLGRTLVTYYSRQHQEKLGAAFLDSRHRILKQREIYVGTIGNALVSTRDIIRFTLEEPSTAIVIYHNHPSGDPTPSDDDITFTRKLKQSLAMIEIDLLDHLIIGTHSFQSMQLGGYMK